MHVALGDHGVRSIGCRRRPARRLPAGLGHTVTKGTCHHEHEIDQAHDHKGLHHPDIGRRRKVLHQVRRQRRTDHGTATKTHDGHTGGHAAPVREPLDQRGHGGDIAQPQTNATNHARTQNHQPELVQIHPQRRHQHATAPAQGRHHPGLARAGMLQPAAPDGGTGTEQHKEQGVHPAQRGDLPIACSGKQLAPKAHIGTALNGFLDAQGLAQRQPEHREAVGHANAQVNSQRCRRHQPPVEAGAGNDAFLVQDSWCCHGCCLQWGVCLFFYAQLRHGASIRGACAPVQLNHRMG